MSDELDPQGKLIDINRKGDEIVEIRVFGPPGTGKTTLLSKWISQAAQKHGSRNIIVASFTKTAAAELVGRDLPLAPDQIGTLHAHAYRAIGTPEVCEVPAKIKEWNDYIAGIDDQFV